MNNRKTTKKALLMSALSLLLCFSMLIGTTFAWFTDSVESGVNTIYAGNLDVELYHQDSDSGKQKITAQSAPLFNDVTLWEPGAVAYEILTVANEGTLALTYKLYINFDNENTIGEYGLSQILKIAVVDPAKLTNRESALAAAKEAGESMTLESFFLAGALEKEKEQQIGLVIWWEPSADDNNWNVNNGKVVSDFDETGKNELHINLGVHLFATQMTAEKDSFDELYDTLTIVGSYEEFGIQRTPDGTYILSKDFEIEKYLNFGPGSVTELYLAGKTLTAKNLGQYFLIAQNGAKMILNGEGTVNMGKGFYVNKENAQIIINGGTYHMTVTGTLNNIKHTALAQNNSKIVINGGTFTTDVEDACLFFATSNATIEVNGGFFENTADKTPDLFSMGTNKSNTNRIIITGGTFVNWNPLNDRMCYTGEWPEAGMAAFGGPWMLIPGGYTVISETQANGDIWYTVVPVDAAN